LAQPPGFRLRRAAAFCRRRAASRVAKTSLAALLSGGGAFFHGSGSTLALAPGGLNAMRATRNGATGG